MNIAPYGMSFEKPVGVLEEAIKVMRLLWSTTKPVDFHGKHFNLENAVLGLEPYEGVPPQVWVAAHGPRMLRITGRLADGWLPTNIKPDAYADEADARSARPPRAPAATPTRSRRRCSPTCSARPTRRRSSGSATSR